MQTVVEYGFAGSYETTLFHYSSRCMIICEMSADERTNNGCFTNMCNHQPKSFGTDALSPIWLTYPIAHRGFSFPSRQGAVARRTIANGSYCLACFVPYDGPCGGIIEHGADYLQTLLFRLMRLPTCTRSYLRVTCVFIQSLGISVKPRAKRYSFCFHHEIHFNWKIIVLLRGITAIKKIMHIVPIVGV